MFPRSHSEHLEKSVGEFVSNIPEEVIFKLNLEWCRGNSMCKKD